MTLYKVTAWSDLYLTAYGRLRSGEEVDIPEADERLASELVERGLLERAEPEAPAEPAETDPSVDEKMGPEATKARKRGR